MIIHAQFGPSLSVKKIGVKVRSLYLEAIIKAEGKIGKVFYNELLR